MWVADDKGEGRQKRSLEEKLLKIHRYMRTTAKTRSKRDLHIMRYYMCVKLLCLYIIAIIIIIFFLCDVKFEASDLGMFCSMNVKFSEHDSELTLLNFSGHMI